MISKGFVIGVSTPKSFTSKSGNKVNLTEYYIAVENPDVTGSCVLKFVDFRNNNLSINDSVYCEVDRYYSKIISVNNQI